MTFLRFIAAHYGFVILVAFVSYVIGLRLTRRISYDSVWEEISMCVSVGLGVICYLVFVLGLVHVLYRWVLVLTLSACIAFCYSVFPLLIKRLRTSQTGKRFGSRLGVGALLLAISTPILILPLYPPTAFDETMYFLTSAKIFARDHQLVFTPYLRFPVFPQLNEMLFTLGLSLYDDIAVHVIQLLMLATLATAIIAFCRRHFTSRAGWWSLAILLANPLVLWVGSVAYVDIAFMLFTAMASYSFYTWTRNREEHWLILSGVFCGLAASAKYPGLFLPIPLGLVLLYLAIREKSYWLPVRFAAVTLAALAPWYIRNFYYTGNPIFPFLPELFGHHVWTPGDIQGLTAEMQLHGVGRSVLSLLTLPWHLTFNQREFLAEAPLSPLYLFSLPAVAISAFKDARIRSISILIAAFTLFWFFSAQILRYILPVIPMLSIVTAASFDLLLDRVPLVRNWSRHAIVIALLSAGLVSEGWWYAFAKCQKQGVIPVTQAQRDQYLTQYFPSYPMYKLMNELKGDRYTVYAVYDEDLAYYVDGVYMGDFFGPARYDRIYDKLLDGQALYNELKSMGVDYFLVNHQRSRLPLPQDKFFQENFKFVDSRRGAVLFDLTGSVEREIGPQLLKNPGFEQIKEGSPVGWVRVGTPIIDVTGRNSYSGVSAVRCIGADNVFYQLVAAGGGRDYLLSVQIRGIAEAQKARLQVNWSDAQGNFLSADLQIIEAGTEWRRVETTLTAPGDAAYAVVYATCHETGSAWFDDFSFAESKLLRR